jgi:hypothetical protein
MSLVLPEYRYTFESASSQTKERSTIESTSYALHVLGCRISASTNVADSREREGQQCLYGRLGQ